MGSRGGSCPGRQELLDRRFPLVDKRPDVPFCFDTDDLCLDLVLRDRPACGYDVSLKDAEDLLERAALGIYRDEEVARISAAGEEAAELAVAGAPPSDDTWRGWQADAAWTLPDRLPDDWTKHLPTP